MLKNEPLNVCIRGLEYMNDDPSMVDVLYAIVSLTDYSNRYIFLLFDRSMLYTQTCEYHGCPIES